MKLRFSLACAVLFARSLLAQSVPPAVSPPQQNGANESELVELSPFQVTAEAFRGYYASQTLAGTRLKTNVDEVASSIQIITPEFMEDIGANNTNQALLFATSTESSGINGNFSDFRTGNTSTDDGESRANPQASQRVRGLASADLTRNYFLSLIPNDRFNTEVTEINRGANAILFGLGSPAGIINTQLKSAAFKSRNEVRVAIDSENSLRTELDLNRVLAPRKVALRIAALDEDRRYYQHPAFERNRRVYGALTIRPWEGGQFRAHVEDGRRDANRPNTLPPASTIASWINNQPLLVSKMRATLAASGVNLNVPDNYPLIYSPLAQSYSITNYLTSASIPSDIKLAILRNAIIFNDNNAANPRMAFHPNMSRQIAVTYQPGAIDPSGAVGGVSAIESNITAITNPPLSLNPDGVGTAPAYNYLAPEQPWRTNPVLIPISLTNLSMLDFTRKMLSGNAAFQNDRWTQQNFSFEQTALEEQIGLEMAYDKQSYHRRSYVPFQGFTGIFVDLMQDYLGLQNPNLGRPFVMDRVSLNRLADERESFRATTYARVEPQKLLPRSVLARWVGRQTFTGVYSRYRQSSQSDGVGQYYQNSTGGFVFGPTDPQGSNRRKVNNIIYLGDSVIGARSESDIHLQPLTTQRLWNPGRTATIRTYNANGTFQTVTLDTAEELETRALDLQKTDTLAATWNGSLLHDHLIGLFGLRRDSVLSEKRAAVTGADLLADLNTLSTAQSLLSRLDSTFQTKSWSVVGKWPQGLVRLPFASKVNFYYGKSENFSLGATANDFSGAQLPSPAGTTKEYGAMINLFDGKLVARINRYESAITNNAADSVYAVLVGQGILKPYGFLLEAQAKGRSAATPNYDVAMTALAKMKELIPARTLAAANLSAVGANGIASRAEVPNLGDTQDIVGTGTEFEVVYNATPAWRIAVNVAHQNTVSNNYAPRLGELWAKFEPILGAGGTIGNLSYFNDAGIQDYISGPAPVAGDGQLTVAQWLEANVLAPYRNQKKQEGRVSNEQRPWRVNFVTNYDFRHERLKGFGVGTAVRWQDGAVIGYPTQLINGTLVSDISHPHVAPSITNIDAWTRYRRQLYHNRIQWTVELRVQNLNHTAQDLIPVRAENTVDYRVAQYRIGPPRVWTLSNTFKF